MAWGYIWAASAMLTNVACQQFLSRAFSEIGKCYAEKGNFREAIQLGMADVGVWIGGGLAASSLLLWACALSQLPISKALPVMALVFVLSPLVASWLLGDSVRLINIIGFVLIAVGVVCSSFR